ncbi:thiamine pyrophosphate-binding protein [Xylanibacter brevis]|uniref:thiamine pyrophosphate-binding protein n=1 Tax=Xylanibacter brevis TaxID=83231 RepID=UPI0005C6B4B2|nr:thiamine pyrophosphate-binding protein [Xylanibacter brevis]
MNQIEKEYEELRYKTGCYYTSERNKQIIIYLLKKYKIQKVVVSPGATNFALVGSMQHDPFFEMYSCVDERAAAYMAIGISEKSNEPVVLSCTGATASRNYMAALTYAYERNIPILVITSSVSLASVGHLRAQVTDRAHSPIDMVYKSYQFDNIKDGEDEWNQTVLCNEAFSILLNVRKPILINVCTTYSTDFSVKELPNARFIPTITSAKDRPVLPQGNIFIFIGSHPKFTERQTKTIEDFCSNHNAVVLCDHTSGYSGKYKVNMSLVLSQERYVSKNRKACLLIHLGEISGDYYTFLRIGVNEVWRVNPDGAYVDFFKKLTNVFKMQESDFFSMYLNDNVNTSLSFFNNCNKESEDFYNRLPEIPFSNIWIAKELSPKLPLNSQIHFGILNSLRSWDFFNLPDGVESVCNVGGFGIDGCVSSHIGAALANPEKLFFGVVGDLTFYYDSNILLNKKIPKNIRLIVVNNGRGTEFRNYCHPASQAFGIGADAYVAAAGHFGQQINSAISNLCEAANIDYYRVEDKESFEKIESKLLDIVIDKPIIIEAITTPEYDNLALKTYRQFAEDSSSKIKHLLSKCPLVLRIIRLIRR